VVALVGPSGSGKTTLLNILCGWDHPDEGNIHRVTGSSGEFDWTSVSIVPQRLGLIDELTISENVALPLKLSGTAESEAEQRVEELLDSLGLNHISGHLPGEASLGEQQRTAMARGLVSNPGLLLADEPTGHQDADSERAVFGAIRALASGGGTCLVATHNSDATRFCHRIMRVDDGRVVVEARAADGDLDRELSPFAPQGRERGEEPS
jgi:putative ABC transport system ATP-binding protein